MKNNNFIDRNMSIGKLVLTLMMLLLVVVGGTFAWLTYASKQSALVLTIGNINDLQIQLTPYQVNGSLLPSTGYNGSNSVSSDVTITQGSTDNSYYALFYKVNNIDQTLLDAGLSYTIVNTTDNKTVTKTFADRLTELGKTISEVDEIVILDSFTDTSLSAATATAYKVYVWLPNTADQSTVQNSTLDIELNASIGSVDIVGASVYGHKLSVDINDAIIDATAPGYKYQWFWGTTDDLNVATAGCADVGATVTGSTVCQALTVDPNDSDNDEVYNAYANPAEYIVGSGLAGKYIYVVVTSSTGKTLSDVTDATNDYTIDQNCDNYGDGRVERETPIITLSATSGTVEAGSDNSFKVTYKKGTGKYNNNSTSSTFTGTAYTGTLTATSTTTTNVSINSLSTNTLSSNTSTSTVSYHGVETEEATSAISVNVAPSSSANICPVSATYTVNKVDTKSPTIDEFELKDCDTFYFEASDIVGGTKYIVTTSSSTPSLTATGWVDLAGKNVSADVDVGPSTSAKTYYLWIRDAKGNISASKSTSTIKIVRELGYGTTLITRYNSTSNSSGTAFTTTPYYVLAKCSIYSTTGTDKDDNGYNTSHIHWTIGSAAEKDVGTSYYEEVSEDTTIRTENVTPNTYYVSYTMNNGTLGSSAPTTWTYDVAQQISNPTKTGYTFTGWTFNGDTSTAKYGTSSAGATTSWSSQSTKVTQTWYKNLTPENEATVTLTAHWEKTVTGTFYYWNGTTITSTTSSCTMYDAATTCTITLPSAVSSSKGQYGNTYIGVSESLNSMTTTSNFTISDNKTYYAVYRTNVTEYYSTTSTAATSRTIYRNSVFTSASNLKTVLAAGNTEVENTSVKSTTGQYSTTWIGYATTTNTMSATYSSFADAVTSSSTSLYSLYQTEQIGIAHIPEDLDTLDTALGLMYFRNLFFTSTTAVNTVLNASATGTSNVEFSENGYYGTKLIGFATSSNTMTPVYETVAAAAKSSSTSLYGLYQLEVKEYYSTASKQVNSRTLYRNMYCTSKFQTTTSISMNVVLSTSSTGTASASSVSTTGYYSTELIGYATTTDTMSMDFLELSGAIKDDTNVLYGIYEVEVKEYYSTTSKQVNNRTLYRNMWFTSTSAMSTVLNTSVTGKTNVDNASDTGYYNTTWVGYASATNTMSVAYSNVAAAATSTSTSIYSLYRSDVTEYYSTTSTQVNSRTIYRNMFFTSTSAMSTILNSTKTSTSNFSDAAGYYSTTWVGYATTTGTMTASYVSSTSDTWTQDTAWSTRVGAVEAAATSTSTTLYRLYRTKVTEYYSTTSKQVNSRTIYRNMWFSSTSEMTTVFSTSQTGTENVGVASTTGYYNTAWTGYATSTGTMTATYGNYWDALASSSTVLYGVYYIEVTEYYSTTSTQVNVRKYLYRNMFFTSTSAMSTVLSTSTTGTSNYTPAAGYYNTTWVGYATSTNTMSATYTSVAAAATSTSTTLYGLYRTSVKEYYTSSSTTATNRTLYRNMFFSSTSAMSTILNTSTTGTANVSVGATTGSYCTTWIGYATNTGTMSTTYATIAAAATSTSTSLYSVYRTGSIKIYYPTSESVTSSVTNWYRNLFFASTSATKVVISDSSTGTSHTTPTEVSGYTFAGYATAVNSMTYVTAANAAKTCTATFYAVSTQSVTATFYYNSNETSGSLTISTTTSSGNMTLYPTSTTAATVNNGSITIPSAVTGSVGQYNNAYAGVQADSDTTPPGNMSDIVTSITTASKIYWTAYRTAVTEYYIENTVSTTRTLYRNSWFTSTNAMSTVLSTSNTGTSDASDLTVNVYSASRIGYATTNNTMSTTYTSLAQVKTSTSTSIYNVYQREVTLYYPSSTAACTSAKWYFNYYFISSSSYNAIVADSKTGTSDSTPPQVSGYSFAGYVYSTGLFEDGELLSSGYVATAPQSAIYAVSQQTITGTFYYYSGGVKTTTATGVRKLYCSSTTAASINNGSITIPTAVTGSKGPNGNAAYVGVQADTNTTPPGNMNNIVTSVTTANNVFWTAYSTKIAIYVPISTSVCESLGDLYRNAYFTSTSDINSVVDVTSTGTENISNPSAVSGYDFYGFATAVNSSTQSYNSILSLTLTSSTTFYGVFDKSVAATFYYYNSGVKNGTASANQYLVCTSTATAGLKNSNITAPVTITSYTAQYGSDGQGWSKSTSSMSTMTPTTANTKYYGVYRDTVTEYYTTSSSTATKRSLYRNAYFTSTSPTSTSDMSTVLSTSTTGTANASVASSTGSYGTGWLGYATSTNTMTVAYDSVAEAVTSTSTSLYSLYNTMGITIYYPTSTSTCSNKVVQRHVYFTSTGATTAVLADSLTSTANTTMSTAVLSTYSFGGFSTATSNGTISYSSVSAAAASSYGTLYAVYTYAKTIVFYYYDDAVTYTTSNGIVSLVCSSTTSATLLSGNVLVPSAVSSSKGQYNNAYVGVVGNESVSGNMNASMTTATTINTLFPAYYAVYRTSVTEYYTTSSTSATSRTLYRNSFITAEAGDLCIVGPLGETDCMTRTLNTVLSNSTDGLVNVSSAGSTIGRYYTTWIGYAKTTNTMTAAYLSIYSASQSSATSLYSLYRTSVNHYMPTSLSSVTPQSSLYRNVYFTSNSATTVVLSSTSTGTTNATISSANGTYSWYGFAISLNTYSASYTSVSSAASSSSSNLYSILKWTPTITIVYNSNTTAGSFTKATASSTGNILIYCVTEASASTNYQNITIPSTVSSSVGKWNSSYVGVASSTGTMSASATTVSGGTYYAIYRQAVAMKTNDESLVYENSTHYRNEYFTSASEMTAVLSNSSTGTSNYNWTNFDDDASDYITVGFSTTTNTTSVTYNAPSYAASSTYTTLYMIKRTSITATFYYNSNTTAGSLTVSSSSSGSAYKYVYFSDASTVTFGYTNFTVPTAVSSSVGKYNSTYVGVRNGTSSMSTVTPTTQYTTYYAIYRKAVTMYRPTSTSAATSATWYRNEYFTSTTAMSTVLSTSSTGTSNSSVSLSGYTFYGYATSVNSYSRTYSSSSAAATSSSTSFYAIFRVSYTLSYNANGGSGTAPTTSTSSRYVYCTTTSSATITSAGTFTLASNTYTAPTGGTFAGWSTDKTSVTNAVGSTLTANQSYTVYAMWKYTIKYNANGGSDAPSSQTKYYGVPLTLSSTVPTHDNLYNFLGWSTSSSATIAIYAAGGTYSTNPTTATTTLYAVWDTQTSTIT